MISVSTSKSGSNWLDRLRSSRGFPTGHEPDLDRFLASSSSCSSASITRSPRRVNSNHKDVAAAVLVGNVSDVLCDLFNMGECSRNVSKKNGRKQSNPRFFNSSNLESKNNDLCSSDDLRRDKSDNALASSGDNSLNGRNNRNRDNCDVNNDNDNDNNNDGDKVGHEENEKEEDEEDGMIDMKEYTRSEVTVIDTSFEDWKSDKWVFRKKDEWKIKDKKKSKCGGKKRKLLVDDENVELRKNEKNLQLNKGQPQNDKARELLKEAAKFVGKVPQSRFPCPRPPEKLRIESSPVILLKSTPLSNNNNVNGITRLGKSAKKGCPKKFKII